ncbi:epi-neemfruitin B 7-O-acetyltransferse L7AT-like [Arachis hypogaea]|uniref:epi-neemfruitin B 7-O-acetyltransferse L7AT-like n=1 Tax=Arachis hypogaea TaxID=3818 RepID=UPI0007AF5F80|nr:BAHD acyltransferase BIA1-like [Arachis hypogaea]
MRKEGRALGGGVVWGRGERRKRKGKVENLHTAATPAIIASPFSLQFAMSPPLPQYFSRDPPPPPQLFSPHDSQLTAAVPPSPPPPRAATLFYTSQNLCEFPKRLELLKQSLSETLTQFYPLAGRIKDDLSIDCNDEGANFVVAKVNCPITKFLEKPDLKSLNELLATTPYSEEPMIGAHVTNIQVNVFDCGGIAIGFCVSHRIFDANSLNTFTKVWIERATSCNRNSKPLTEPNFAISSLFPTSTLHFRDFSKKIWGSFLKEEKWVTRRIVFKNSTIATLKAQIMAKSSSDSLKNHLNTPTRVQIVYALLWKCFMAASKAQFGTQRPSMVINTVNLRRRMEKSLRPENAIGNFVWLTTLEHMSSEHELSLDELVSKLKKSNEEIDKDFVARLQSEEEGSSIMENALRRISGETWSNNNEGDDEALETLWFNSWCNFEGYDADFGWGKPMWLSSVGVKDNSMLANKIILVDTKFKDGIEAWTTLDEEKMKHLVSSTELLTYATVDPSPLAVASSKL